MFPRYKGLGHPRAIDESGKKYGRLTVIAAAGSIRSKLSWKCRCDCGNEVTVIGKGLRHGLVKSCGCLRKETCGKLRWFHGLSNSIEMRILLSMRKRCFNPNTKAFKNYGGRGIRVCKRWMGPKGIVNFVKDMGTRPSKIFSIDRIDNDGNYEPGNCRWATAKQQRANQRKRSKWR